MVNQFLLSNFKLQLSRMMTLNFLKLQNSWLNFLIHSISILNLPSTYKQKFVAFLKFYIFSKTFFEIIKYFRWFFLSIVGHENCFFLNWFLVNCIIFFVRLLFRKLDDKIKHNVSALMETSKIKLYPKC